jgi:basic membrane lipoprotein Med (substrate-binding protein (PBP1-ABC) superfamily)
MPHVRRISWLAIGLLLTGALGAACSGDESGSTAKAPKAFCQAAYDYEQELNKEIKRGEKNLDKQLALVEKMAEQAPKKISADVDAFVEAMRRVDDDPSLARNKTFQQRAQKIVDNVNRYASNGCGLFKQDPSSGI